jgi:hypothetical protein
MDVLEAASRDGDGGWLEVNVPGDLRCLVRQTLLGEDSGILVHARPAELTSDKPEGSLHTGMSDAVDAYTLLLYGCDNCLVLMQIKIRVTVWKLGS